jgi:hypothetical protein
MKSKTSQIINWLPTRFFYFLLLLCVVFLSFRQQYLGDASYFIEAGKGIISGNNEFKVNALHSGPLGVIFMAAVFGYLGSLSIFLVTLFNLIGIYSFTRILLTGINEKYVFIVALFTLVSSPTREMLVTGQITGIVLGLIAAGSYLLNKFRIQYFGLMPLVLAVELKPHFALPLIFLTLVFSSAFNWGNLKRFSLLILLGHILVNLHLRTISEIDLIKNVLFLTDTKVTTFERSIWTILDSQLLPYVSILLKILLIFSLISVAVFSYKRGSLLQSAVALILIPSSQSYIHLYDFVWMLPVAYLLLHKKLLSIESLSIALVCILMLPHPYWSLLNFILFSVICLIILEFSNNFVNTFDKRNLISTLITAAVLPLFYSSNWLSYQENEAIFHTFVVALFATQLIMKRKESPSSEITQF